MNQSTVRASTSIQNRREMQYSMNWKRASNVSRVCFGKQAIEMTWLPYAVPQWCEKNYPGIKTYRQWVDKGGEWRVLDRNTHLFRPVSLTGIYLRCTVCWRQKSEDLQVQLLRRVKSIVAFTIPVHELLLPPKLAFYLFVKLKILMWLRNSDMMRRQAHHWEMTYFLCVLTEMKSLM